MADSPVPDCVRYRISPIAWGLILAISTTNVFNRLNVTTRQVAGARWEA